MIKRLGKYLLTAAAGLFVMTAQIGISPNCVNFFYDPDVPEILKD